MEWGICGHSVQRPLGSLAPITVKRAEAITTLACHQTADFRCRRAVRRDHVRLRKLRAIGAVRRHGRQLVRRRHRHPRRRIDRAHSMPRHLRRRRRRQRPQPDPDLRQRQLQIQSRRAMSSPSAGRSRGRGAKAAGASTAASRDAAATAIFRWSPARPGFTAQPFTDDARQQAVRRRSRVRDASSRRASISLSRSLRVAPNQLIAVRPPNGRLLAARQLRAIAASASPAGRRFPSWSWRSAAPAPC